MTHPFKLISKNLPTKFLRETINKPWMRLQVFLDEGPLTRTPGHYKKFVYDWKYVTPTPVHYIPEPGRWKKTDNGFTVPVQNFPIPLKYPHELNDGIWGGEAVVKGFIKRKPRRRRVGHYWIPKLQETVLYSEILDKYLKVIVTPRALDLIDENYGLDSYLLKTSPADLMSMLTLQLKKEMLYALLHKTLYPDDPEKKEEMYNKYKEFIIPEEELEWFGLSLGEANRKQMKLEGEEENVGPYKHIFKKELIEYLKSNPSEEEGATGTGISKKSLLAGLSKLNIFSKNK